MAIAFPARLSGLDFHAAAHSCLAVFLPNELKMELFR